MVGKEGERCAEALKVGVVLERREVPAWAAEVLRWIDRSPGCQLAAVRYVSPQSQEPRAATSIGGSVYRLLLGADARLHQLQPDAEADVDVEDVLSHVPRRTEEEAEAAAGLDVVVGFWADPRGERWGRPTTFGYWYPDFEAGPAQTLGLQQTVMDVPHTEVALLASGTGTGPVEIARSSSSTVRTSPRRNRNATLWNVTGLLTAALERLQRTRSLPEPVSTESADPLARATHAVPPAGEAVQFGARYLRAKVHERTYTGQWILGYRHDAAAFGESWETFEEIVPPEGDFWADPFPLYRDGRHYVFFEEYLGRERKGVISVLDISEEGEVGELRRALERPYHLSYPFVFEWEGELYMIPESAQNGTVEAYRCEAFPTQWKPVATLLHDVQAYDATLWPDGERWWLFCNLKRHPQTSSWNELHLFWAEHPLSDTWTPHPANPIVQDVRQARPAGRFFERDGRLYRPAQDCSVRYGYALCLCEVIRLDTTGYEERVVARWRPEERGGVRGLHTLNNSNGLTLIDAELVRRR